MSDEKYESLLRMYNDAMQMIAEKNELIEKINSKYIHLQRKVAHGCTDMSCSECDQ